MHAAMRIVFLAVLVTASEIARNGAGSSLAGVSRSPFPSKRWHQIQGSRMEKDDHSHLFKRAPMQSQGASSSKTSQQRSRTSRGAPAAPKADQDQTPGLGLAYDEQKRVWKADSPSSGRGTKRALPVQKPLQRPSQRPSRSQKQSQFQRQSRDTAAAAAAKIPSVKATASGIGPATIHISRGRSSAGRATFRAEPGEIIDKWWVDSQKLKVDAHVHDVGKLQVTTHGRKVYAGVSGPKHSSAGAETITGPERQQTRAEFSAKAKAKPGSQGTNLDKALLSTGSVSATAERSDGVVGVKAWASGPEIVDVNTLASNSPPSSPLRSRGGKRS